MLRTNPTPPRTLFELLDSLRDYGRWRAELKTKIVSMLCEALPMTWPGEGNGR